VPVTTTAAALEAVRVFFAARASVDAAQVGEPDSPGGITVVACSVIDSPVLRDAFRHEREQNVLALWMRVVQQDEGAVELALADFKDDVWDSWLTARKTGDLQGARLDDTLAGLPDYRRLLSGETRLYPFVVAVPIRRPLP
jgi:hypothetical protein